MDPLSLLASGLQLADAATKAALGLQQLQQQFGGALETVDTLVQQSGCIDVTLRELCVWLCRRSSSSSGGGGSALSPQLASRLTDCIRAIDETVKQVQEHCQRVRTEASRSRNAGRWLHVSRAGKVSQWDRSLAAQMGVLAVMLQVVQLKSDGERVSVLEQASSKQIFEQASSLSAKINGSSQSSAVDRSSANIQSYGFDAQLLDTRVYRRACESSLKQVILYRGQRDDDAESCKPLSVSAPTKDDVADRSDISMTGLRHENISGEERQRNESGSDNEVQDFSPFTPLEAVETPDLEHELYLEDSTRETQYDTMESTNPTQSTMATTVSSQLGEGILDKAPPSHTTHTRSSIVVTVEKVGEDDVDLPARCADYYTTIQTAIFQVRDRILASEPTLAVAYGVVAPQCTIKLRDGEAQTKHTFPLTESFLHAALEQLDQQDAQTSTASIQIHAVFSPSEAPADGDAVVGSLGIVRRKEKPPFTNRFTQRLLHVREHLAHMRRWHSSDVIPCSPEIDGGTTVRTGSYGTVVKMRLAPGSPLGGGHTGYVAVKSFHRGDSSKAREAWQRELKALRAVQRFQEETGGPHNHVISLLTTICVDGLDECCLVFPWAEGGNLREYWRNSQPPYGDSQSMLWMWQQMAGLASGLASVHSVLNRACPGGETGYGRHGDLKPENILYFKGARSGARDGVGDGGILRIADFGLAAFHTANAARMKRDSGKLHMALTPAYRAPECDELPLGQCDVSSAYDIWSMGCVLLEFLVWISSGQSGVDNLHRSRHRYTKDGAFFVTNGYEGASLNPAVAQQRDELALNHSSTTCSPLQAAAGLCPLEIVSLLLSIQPKERPSAHSLAKRLEGLAEQVAAATESHLFCATLTGCTSSPASTSFTSDWHYCSWHYCSSTHYDAHRYCRRCLWSGRSQIRANSTKPTGASADFPHTKSRRSRSLQSRRRPVLLRKQSHGVCE